MNRPAPTRAIRTTRLALGLALALGAGGGSWAQAPAQAPPTPPGRRVLIDGDLQMRTIRLLSLTGDAVVYEDEQGRRRQATVGGFVALLPSTPPYGGAPFVDAGGVYAPPQEQGPPSGAPPRPPATATGPKGQLDLRDGQRFPGEQAPTGGDGDAIVWTHPRFGPITVPLDSVARVVMDAGVLRRPRSDGGAPGVDAPAGGAAGPAQVGGGEPGAPGAAPRIKDEITLVNGDTLTGFLLSLGNPIEIDIDGTTVTLPPERVAAARLAGRAQPLRGMVVWLADGSVAVVASIASKGEQGVSIRLPGGQAAEYPLDAVKAVAFDAGRLRALASIEPSAQAAIGRRLLLDPLRVLAAPGDGDRPDELNAPDVELPGPMSVTWRLPIGARRFGAVAEMPLEALPWGDCELTVSVDGEERFRQRLNEGTPRQEFSVALAGADAGAAPARELTITVSPGAYGPINDRVILRRPLLLVDVH